MNGSGNEGNDLDQSLLNDTYVPSSLDDNDEMQFVDLDTERRPMHERKQLWLVIRVSVVVVILAGCILLGTLLWPSARGLFSPSPSTSSFTQKFITQYSGLSTYTSKYENYIFLYTDTGNAHSTNTIEMIDARSGKPLWHTSGINLSDPYFFENMFFVGSDHGIDAFRISDQKLLWHLNGPTSSIDMSTSGIAFVDSGQGHLMAVQAQDGKLLWSSNNVNFPTIDNDVVLVESTDNTELEALRESDGHMLWQHQVSQAQNFFIENGTLYLNSSQDEDVMALRVNDGAMLWQQKNADTIWQGVNGQLYAFSSSSNNVMELQADTGAIVWQHAIPGSPDGGQPNCVSSFQESLLNGISNMCTVGQGQTLLAFDQKAIAGIAVNGDADMQVLQASNGKVLWRSLNSESLYGLQDSIVFTRRLDNQHIEAQQTIDGKVLWQSSQPGRIVGMADGVVYQDVELNQANEIIGNTEAAFGILAVLRQQDGKQLWHLSSEGQIDLVQDGIAYIYSPIDGTLKAYKDQDGEVLWSYQIPPGDAS